MLEEPDIDTTIFPDLGEGAGDDDIVISNQEFYLKFLSMRENDISDATSEQSSSSDTDANTSGIDVYGPGSGTSSELDQEKGSSSTETDSEEGPKKMEVEKTTTEGEEKTKEEEERKRPLRKTVPRNKRYCRESETEGGETTEAEDSDGPIPNTTLDDFRKEMNKRSEDEKVEYDSMEDEEQHAWKFTGEFTNEGVNYRPSDYVEVSAVDGAGPMFYHIQRISVEENPEVVECKCFRLYRPCDTILGNMSRYCNFNPKELFLYYPDERSCRETIHGKDIKRRITVIEVKDDTIPDVSSDDMYFTRFKYHPRDFVFERLFQGKKEKITKDMTILDIFSGCGGFSEGFRLAGFNVDWAIDSDLGSCCTNSLMHHKTSVVNGDLSKVLDQIKVISQDPKCCALGDVEPLHNLVHIPQNDRHPNLPQERGGPVIIGHEIDKNKELKILLSSKDWKGVKELDNQIVPKLMDYYMNNRALREKLPIERVFKEDRILDVRVHKGVKMYKVRWRFCDEKSARWMPESRIVDKKLITRFYAESHFKIPKRDEVDIIIGGPPCQGAGKGCKGRPKKDPLKDYRNRMVRAYIDYVRYFSPKVAILENTYGIFSMRGGALIKLIIGSLAAMGYNVRCGVLQAAFYGVPQSRWNTFVIATKYDVVLPHFPEPTHWCSCFLPQIDKEYHRMIVVPLGNGRDYKRNVTIYDAIFDLPESAIPEPGRNQSMRYAINDVGRFTEYTKFIRRGSREVTQHVYQNSWRILNIDDKEFKRLNRNKDRPKDDDDSKFAMRVHYEAQKPLCWNYPFPMIKKTLTHYIHPSQKRLLTVREYARAQSFDDTWFFVKKPRSLNEYGQIGSSVPPLLGKAVAESLLKA